MRGMRIQPGSTMPNSWAVALVSLVTAYVGAGTFFAAAFVTLGVSRVDHRAAGASWGFRALIVPGTVLLWPLLAARWVRAFRSRPQPAETAGPTPPGGIEP